MRSLLSLLLLISLFGTSSLLGQQGPWQPAEVPRDAYVPNEFIIHFPHSGETALALEAEFKDNHGLIVDVVRLDYAGRYFLIRLIKTVEERVPSGEFCSRSESVPLPLACKLCDVIGDPGSGTPMDRGDSFVNYIGNAGYNNNTSDYPTYDLETIFPDLIFDPLVGDPGASGPAETSAFRSGSCYEGNNLSFGTVSQRGQLKVAIMDTGIETDAYDYFFEYEDDKGIEHSIVSWETIPESVTGLPVAQENIDENGHGTAVAFLLAHDFVNKNDVADIKLHSYRVLTNGIYGTLANLIWSLSHAIESDVDIINMSFGFRATDCDGKEIVSPSVVLNDLFTQAQAQNILIFTSAGNDNVSLNSNPQWPAAYNNFDNIFTIGADGCTVGQRWEESNYHWNYVDMMAPGVGIAMPHAGYEVPGRFVIASGTSFATPLAASVAASWYAEGGYEAALCALEGSRDINHPDDETIPPNSRLGSIFEIETSECRSIIVNPDFPGPEIEHEFVGRPGAGRQAFPNPFTEALNVPVEVAPGGVATVRVLDGNGRLVLQRQTGANLLTLPTHDLVPGLYFMQIADENGSRVQRIIKQ